MAKFSNCDVKAFSMVLCSLVPLLFVAIASTTIIRFLLGCAISHTLLYFDVAFGLGAFFWKYILNRIDFVGILFDDIQIF